MDDDLPVTPFELPVKAEASASASYSVEHKKFTFDSKVYPLCTNKIEDVGLLKKRKFSIVCDRHGHMDMKELLNPFQKIERLGKLHDKGYLTDKEFSEAKEKILSGLE